MGKKRSPNQIREFTIDSDTHKEQYNDNGIRTSKYTPWNFAPKALILQFKRIPNIYFLVAAVLQCIGTISSLSPFSAVAPFAFVLFLSIVKEGFEDFPRQQSDKKVNNDMTPIIDKQGNICQVKWKDVQVSSLQIIKEGEEFPSDLILLKSSNENGMAFLETASLDGEKNLKPKFSLAEIAAYFNGQSVKNSKLYSCSVLAQAPNPSIYHFEGAFINEDQNKLALSAKQLLLRGARLKNTEWVIGVVVYTGHDTKIMRNAEVSKTKVSRIEKMVNRYVACIFAAQMVLCAAAAIANRIWSGMYLADHWYLHQGFALNLEGFYMFLSYFLLTNTMIPISLVVTLEIVKFIQARWMEFDEDMINVDKKKGLKVFCSSINEELGLVDYIFSDKTGTLTSNEMVFKNFIIGKEQYGAHDKPKFFPDKGYVVRSDSIRENYVEQGDEQTQQSERLNDKKLHQVLESQSSEPLNFQITGKNGGEGINFRTHKDLVVEFLQSIATCHECLAEKDKDGKIVYQGQSQDEIRLVETASEAGFTFLGGNLEKMQVSVMGNVKEFQLLQIFEFTSDRKRMSVIVRDGTTIKLYMKGADNMVLDRLRIDVEQPFRATVDERLEDFSRKGYRTLVFAMKVMSEDEYIRMKGELDDIAADADREDKTHQIAERIERDLYLIGCSAVEDRLQDNVPKVIDDFLRAKIKVWMLTGDKLETAENIAHSCKLITGQMHVMRCFGRSEEAVKAKLKENKENFDMCVQEKKQKAFIIEGEALAYIFANKEMEEVLISIVLDCESVILCRATPRQKAEMVRLVKTRTGKITLAVGDGANDVNMIQAANIGIGLYGHEGVQAVQASDYAIPEFKALWRLLMVHGRWSYLRISEMVLYFFYKNMIFTLPQFYYAFLNGFSAQTIYDSYYVAMYNMIVTAFPLGTKAVLEKDIDYKIVLPSKQITETQAYRVDPAIKKVLPELYYQMKGNLIFTTRAFVISVLEGAAVAIILFVFAIYGVNHHSIGSSGEPHDLWSMSIALYTAVIWVVSIKLCVWTRFWNVHFVLTLVGLTFIVYYVFTFIYNIIPSEWSSFTVLKDYQSFVYWAFVIFFVGLQLLFDLTRVTFQKVYNPTSADVLRREQAKEKKYTRNKIVEAPHSAQLEKKIINNGFELLPISNKQANELMEAKEFAKVDQRAN